jgi:phosphopantetheine--protein transferase-like protein
MLVGNDVVDLGDPEADPAGLHPRFAERVLAPEERRAVRSSADPARALWTYWAAKESACKVLRKLEGGAVFSPSSLVVEIEERNGGRLRGRVRCKDRVFRLEVEERAAWTHALATASPPGSREALILTGVSRRPPRQDPSAALRSATTAALSRRLGWAAGSLRIAGSRPPTLLLRGREAGVDLSLSHHGRWMAYAAACPPGARPARG